MTAGLWSLFAAPSSKYLQNNGTFDVPRRALSRWKKHIINSLHSVLPKIKSTQAWSNPLRCPCWNADLSFAYQHHGNTLALAFPRIFPYIPYLTLCVVSSAAHGLHLDARECSLKPSVMFQHFICNKFYYIIAINYKSPYIFAGHRHVREL